MRLRSPWATCIRPPPAQALANAAHNATNAQQQSYVTAQAATTMGVATLYSLDTASTGIATMDILKSKVKGLG